MQLVSPTFHKVVLSTQYNNSPVLCVCVSVHAQYCH